MIKACGLLERSVRKSKNLFGMPSRHYVMRRLELNPSKPFVLFIASKSQDWKLIVSHTFLMISKLFPMQVEYGKLQENYCKGKQ
jgi:hypothetical protein